MSILLDENTQGGFAPLHPAFGRVTPRIDAMVISVNPA